MALLNAPPHKNPNLKSHRLPRGQFSCAFFLLALPAIAQDAPFVASIEPSGPRIGDVAPAFALPAQNGTTFDSRKLLGQKSLFLLLEGDAPLIGVDEKVVSQTMESEKLGIATVLAASNPAAGKTYILPQPFTTLRDETRSWSKNFQLPAFVAIDRAGWLRQIETLAPNDPTKLRFLMQRSGDPTPHLKEGEPAPDFSFRDADGVWRRPSALRGQKNLLITFFPRCFTGRCGQQMSSLRDSFPALIAAQTEVWAVSVDPADGEKGQKAFIDYLKLPFPLLPDVGRNVCLLYGAAQTPQDLAFRQSVLIDKNGVVRWIDRAVRATTHAEDVLAKMKALEMLPAG